MTFMQNAMPPVPAVLNFSSKHHVETSWLAVTVYLLVSFEILFTELLLLTAALCFAGFTAPVVLFGILNLVAVHGQKTREV